MQKNKIEKLSRFADEEKNKVKAKREQLERLKTELEMIRIINGNAYREEHAEDDELVINDDDPESG